MQMKLNPSLFLAITASLAGTGACIIKNADPQQPTAATASTAATAPSATAPTTTAPAASGDPNARQLGHNLKEVRGIGGLDGGAPAATDAGSPATEGGH